jgi:hypothetical protein
MAVGMPPVKVTVAVGTRVVPLDEVKDSRIRTALQGAVKQVTEKLAKVRCPVHDKGPADLRIHFDRSGGVDLKYDSCCPALGEKVGQALG